MLIQWGFEDGESKGFRDGEIKGAFKELRDAVLRLVQKRGLVLTEEQLARVRTCEDRTLLHLWLDRTMDAQSCDELFR